MAVDENLLEFARSLLDQEEANEVGNVLVANGEAIEELKRDGVTWRQIAELLYRRRLLTRIYTPNYLAKLWSRAAAKGLVAKVGEMPQPKQPREIPPSPAPAKPEPVTQVKPQPEKPTAKPEEAAEEKYPAATNTGILGQVSIPRPETKKPRYGDYQVAADIEDEV